jgi:hypothetical protein
MRPSARLLLLSSAMVLVGCGHFRRVGECRRLAERVNGALDEISAMHDAGGATALSYRDIASRYERLGHDVEGFARADDGFSRTIHEYSAFFADTARVLLALSDALDRSDEPATARARKDLAALLRRDKALAARIDAACSEM